MATEKDSPMVADKERNIMTEQKAFRRTAKDLTVEEIEGAEETLGTLVDSLLNKEHDSPDIHHVVDGDNISFFIPLPEGDQRALVIGREGCFIKAIKTLMPGVIKLNHRLVRVEIVAP